MSKTVFGLLRQKIIPLSLTGAFVLHAGSAQAIGINSVLDGMFANVTAPNVIDSQLRGGLAGGGVYVRSPISSIQLFAVDPPRITAGCGGIDLYLGSFSFITADRLVQFLRNVAQNAAPLAFQMALESVNPVLSGMLKKFQSMAQQANDLNKNSCQLAHGLIDGKTNLSEVTSGLMKTIGDTVSTVKGLFSDFAESKEATATDPSKNIKTAEVLTTTVGGVAKKAVNAMGNITWNAIILREQDGFSFSGLADDSQRAKEIIMSMIGTNVRSSGATNADEPKVQSFDSRLRIIDFVEPRTNPDGSVGVPIYKCVGGGCLSLSPDYYATKGIKGYVNKMMTGSESATATPTADSIVGLITGCAAASCGLTVAQKKFLGAIGSVPAVGLLRHSQKASFLINSITPSIVDMMVDQIALKYAEAIVDIAVTTYAGTEIPRPADYDLALSRMQADLTVLRDASKKNLEQMKVITASIDAAIRANAKASMVRAMNIK